MEHYAWMLDFALYLYIYYISWLCFALHAANANQYANQSLGKLVDVGR